MGPVLGIAVYIILWWLMPENFAKGPAHFFNDVPGAMRDQVRQQVLDYMQTAMRVIGIGRHTQEEMLELADRSLLALSELLGDKRYLFGERPVGVDATAFAMIAAAQTAFFSSPLQRRAHAYRNLNAYVDRMMRIHYADAAWSGSEAEEVH